MSYANGFPIPSPAPPASAFRFWWTTLLLFMLIYNISFLVLPALSTGRIAVFMLAFAHYNRNRASISKFARENSGVLLTFACILVYALAEYIFGGREDTVQLSRLINYFIFSIFGVLAFANYVEGDLKYFFRCYSMATFIQSLFVVFSFFSEPYREWLSGVLVQGGNNALTFAGRPPGFANASGAAFSVTQALGCFSALWVIRTAKGKWESAWHTIALIVIFISAVLTGRTGLIMGVVFILAFMISARNKIQPSVAITAFLFCGTILAIGVIALNHLLKSDPILERNLNYVSDLAFEIFIRGGRVSSVSHISRMSIPPLNYETLLGTGLVRASGINESGNDSGFIQTYYALGLIMCVVFYLAFLKMNLRYIARNAEKGLLLLLLVVMFFIESKEPFIFKYSISFFCLIVFGMGAGLGLNNHNHNPDLDADGMPRC